MTTSEELDADIIHEALWGKPPGSGRAFRRVYEHYELRVRNAVARAAQHSGYLHRVEELRQDVWVRLLERDRKLIRYYKPECGSLGSFLCRIAYQQTLSAVQLDRRQVTGDPFIPRVPEFETEDLPDDDALHIVANVIQGDIYRKIMARAAEELEEIDLLVIREVYVGQRTFREVAVEHRVKPERLYKRNERLKKKLIAWSEQLIGSGDDFGVFRAGHSNAPPAMLVAVILAGLTFPHPDEFGPFHPFPSLCALEGA